MTAIISTGMSDFMLDEGSVKEALDLGFINIYTTPVPVHADDAPTGSAVHRLAGLRGRGPHAGRCHERHDPEERQ